MKIIKARITEMPKNWLDPMPKVMATTEDNVEHELFSYYPDEISFTAQEFIGLTIAEGKDLRRKKDLNY